jgi:predicted nucleic acid-binding protein
MSDVVVDSSVVAKWILPEADSSRAVRLRTEVPAAGGRLIVLDLILPEVGNAIWKSHRQKSITLPEARKGLAALKSIPLHIEPAARLLDQAFEIAVKYYRAFYDALFVALVQDLRVKGVTADEPLYNTTHVDFPQIVLLRNWP